jgi:hypothetical protein
VVRSLTCIFSFSSLCWWPLLDIENILLEPVTRRQEDFPPFPPTPGPPSKSISKCDDRCWSASTRRMLKVIALVQRTPLKEAAVEMIVQSFA